MFIYKHTLKLPTCEEKYRVLSTRFFMGNIIARIYSESDPGAGFELVEPDLEDIYFCVMKEPRHCSPTTGSPQP